MDEEIVAVMGHGGKLVREGLLVRGLGSSWLLVRFGKRHIQSDKTKRGEESVRDEIKRPRTMINTNSNKS